MTIDNKLFLSTKFTGYHKNTTLVSISLISKNSTFYAEANDFNLDQCDAQITEDIINKLKFYGKEIMEANSISIENNKTKIFGNKDYIKSCLETWLSNEFTNLNLPTEEKFRIWSCHLTYTWILFNDFWGGVSDIPEIAYIIPFDICTLMEVKGVSPDRNRDEFAYEEALISVLEEEKYTALWEANVIKRCYEKLIKMSDHRQNK